MKVSILYGSTTGSTEQVADLLKNHLSGHEVKLASVTSASELDVKEADVVLLGSSTWGYGELQDDFADYIDKINADLYGNKKVAVFGCGDSVSFSDVFCEAVTTIEAKLEEVGATLLVEGLRVDGSVEDNIDKIEEFSKNIV